MENLDLWLRNSRRAEMERKVAALPMLPDRFWNKVGFRFINNDWCWEWIGARRSSFKLWYGVIRFEDLTLAAHRVMYLVTYGEISNGLVVHHKCRNTLCVNPNHLLAVTKRDNILMGESIGARNFRKTECKRGHKLEGENLIQYPGKRVCRTCQKMWQVRFRQSRKLQ